MAATCKASQCGHVKASHDALGCFECADEGSFCEKFKVA